MKKQNRIKKNEDFQVIFKNGQSFANRQFVLYFMKKSEQDHFRVGLSVGKKVGNAVTRNRVKRYIREVINYYHDNIPKDYDLLIIARKPTETMGLEEVKKSLTHVLKRSKLLR